MKSLVYILVEFNAHSFLDAVHHGDLSRVKKLLTNETINFRHFKTGDSPLVSFFSSMKLKIKAVYMVFSI